MKALIILVLFGSAMALLIWRLRKSQAEADLARHRALERRKNRDREALSQDTEMIWPAIIRPVSGKHPPGDDEEIEEPTMTSIEFAPSDETVAQKGGSRKIAS